MSVFLQFVYLQALDLLTTLAFLAHGVEEANPVVRLLLDWIPSRLAALAAVKLAAVGLALYCWRCGRLTLLKRVTWFYAVLALWNLAALVAVSTA
ncbi:MAG: DUF5658 family protein [Bryobacterales bacterium]|nr:DUF5658 family protein [Bryobacteraceae bacterium]MDW8354231.1 DUF5658 family protein [Bryobacterales bacterium]